MGTARKLTAAVHDILVDAFRQGKSKALACRAADIHRNTLNSWLKAGESSKSGKQRALYEAVMDARSSFWEAKQSELEQVVYKQATEGDTTVSMKFSRVMKVSAEDSIFIEAAIEKEPIEKSEELKARFEAEGVLYKQEVAIRQHRPDGQLALEVLARRAPEEWGRYETLKLEFDVKEELKKLGLDPEEVIRSVVANMDQMIAAKGGDGDA